jgi:hypothetical protein
MNQTMSKQFRLIAIAPTARGFGYCVMEDESILECGYKGARKNKNAKSLSKIGKLMTQFLPSGLVLQDLDAVGCRRVPRIKVLHQQVVGLAEQHKCQVELISGKKLRRLLLDDERGTKYEMAETLAKQFPNELAGKLPPKRRPWENEDGRMDMFDAVGLAAVFRISKR